LIWFHLGTGVATKLRVILKRLITSFFVVKVVSYYIIRISIIDNCVYICYCLNTMELINVGRTYFYTQDGRIDHNPITFVETSDGGFSVETFKLETIRQYLGLTSFNALGGSTLLSPEGYTDREGIDYFYHYCLDDGEYTPPSDNDVFTDAITSIAKLEDPTFEDVDYNTAEDAFDRNFGPGSKLHFSKLSPQEQIELRAASADWEFADKLDSYGNNAFIAELAESLEQASKGAMSLRRLAGEEALSEEWSSIISHSRGTPQVFLEVLGAPEKTLAQLTPYGIKLKRERHD